MTVRCYLECVRGPSSDHFPTSITTHGTELHWGGAGHRSEISVPASGAINLFNKYCEHATFEPNDQKINYKSHTSLFISNY